MEGVCKENHLVNSSSLIKNYQAKFFSFGIVCCFIFTAMVTFGQRSENSKFISENAFPATLEFSMGVSDTLGGTGEQLSQATDIAKESIRNIVKHGFTDFWIYNFSGDSAASLLNFAQSIGMGVDYMTSGFELFNRERPGAVSVYSPQYGVEIKKKIALGLAPIKRIQRIRTVFPFLDEPFHADDKSFDFSQYARAEFQRHYGYPMPVNLESVRDKPREWLDLLNFQSNTFTDGWKQVYKEVKAFDPRPRIVMTHDSHNCFGAGVKSNSLIAIDDVFHWGGDFADIYAYDIYPYMTFDYRYGELGRLPKPRISQMHYTIAQMRNLTTAYGKDLGFWVGTYSDAWFTRFKGPERKNQFWSEREICYSAIAQGANFIISPSNYKTTNLPIDSMHWADYGNAMNIIQRVGAGLLKAPKVKARACFLFPRTQYLQLQEEYYNVGLSFELFLRAFGELDIIHEDQITDDKLNGYKVLVLGDVKLLPVQTARHITSFVNNGGIVIADCVPQMDAYKKPMDDMKKLFGVKYGGTDRIDQQGQWVPFSTLPAKMSFPPAADQEKQKVITGQLNGRAFGHLYNFPVVSPRPTGITNGTIKLKMKSGQAALIEKKTGKGTAYLFGFCIQDTYFRTWKDDNTEARKQLRQLLGDVFTDANVHSHIYSSNPDIEASVRANKNTGYIFIINHESERSVTSVRVRDLQFEIGRIVDIESGKQIRFKRSGESIEFTINSPLGTTRLLKATP